MNNSVSLAGEIARESVTPMTLHSFDVSNAGKIDVLNESSSFRSRSCAFAALARFAAANKRMTESVELYRLAVEEGEECWGPDSEQVKVLLIEIAGVYSSLGQDAICVFYQRRANSI